MLHAVEVEHSGDHDASVVYVASAPSTPINRKYLKQQLQNFLQGLPPPDFDDTIGIAERTLMGYVGEDAIYGQEGRRAFGFDV